MRCCPRLTSRLWPVSVMIAWLAVVACCVGSTAARATAVVSDRDAASCVGDCAGDGAVSISDLVRLVNIALDQAPLATCPGGDHSGDGTITVEEILAAVNNALAGCSLIPGATPTTSPTLVATPSPAATRASTATATPRDPWIAVPAPPRYGTSGDLHGQTGNVDPGAHRIAVYVDVQGWWTKPSFDSPTVPIRIDRTWSADITTGGCDQYATRIAALLIPADYVPPRAAGSATLPDELFTHAVASVVVERGPPTRYLEFAGYPWAVKRFDCPAGPGPNLFSDRPDDVWVDAAGLHLSIAKHDGQWYATEVIVQETFGYGTYVFHTLGRLDVMDPCMVGGLFTWDDATLPWHRELDIEHSRWCNAADPTNAQYVVQPYTRPGNLQRFRLDLADAAADLTQVMNWSAGRVTFETYRGHHSLDTLPSPADRIATWTNDGDDVPTPGGEKVHINFWLFNGQAPASDGRAEFVVTDFFHRAAAPGPPQ